MKARQVLREAVWLADETEAHLRAAGCAVVRSDRPDLVLACLPQARNVVRAQRVQREQREAEAQHRMAAEKHRMAAEKALRSEVLARAGVVEGIVSAWPRPPAGESPAPAPVACQGFVTFDPARWRTVLQPVPAVAEHAREAAG